MDPIFATRVNMHHWRISKKDSRLQAGFTLVELMVGMLACAILTYAAFSLYITQHKQMLVQDEIADMQGNIRAAAETLASALRKAGYNLPGALFNPIETRDTNPDTIIVTFDSGGLVGVTLRYDMVDATDDIRCNVSDDVDALNDGEWALIYDPGTETGELFQTSRVFFGPPRIQHTSMPLSQPYPAGSQLFKITRIKFYLDQSDSTRSDLKIQVYGNSPQTFAENIVDLNFRYFLASGAIVTQTNTPDQIRMVEIDVLGRTASADADFAEPYRTRRFTLRVKVRNLAFNS
jgi:prepilin-type N-terminal cleavage/methylation domain-containing protein